MASLVLSARLDVRVRTLSVVIDALNDLQETRVLNPATAAPEKKLLIGGGNNFPKAHGPAAVEVRGGTKKIGWCVETPRGIAVGRLENLSIGRAGMGEYSAAEKRASGFLGRPAGRLAPPVGAAASTDNQESSGAPLDGGRQTRSHPSDKICDRRGSGGRRFVGAAPLGCPPGRDDHEAPGGDPR